MSNDKRVMPGPSGSRSTPANEVERSASRPVAISATQFRELMSAITATQDSVDDKLAKFLEEIQKGQEEAAMRAIKWSRYEKP